MNASHSGPSPRYRALDGYRFIAASLIVLFHYNGDFGLGIERVTPIVKSLDVMVDFFFVLSGFVIATTYANAMGNFRDYGDFLRRRLARVLPLHLAVLAAFVGLALAVKFGRLPANHPEMLDLGTLPANALLLHAWGFFDHLTFNGPSWSISAEWLVYLIFPLLLLSSRRYSLATNLALVIGSIAAMTAWRHTEGLRGWSEATYDFGALRAVPTFFLGVMFAMLPESHRKFFRAPWPFVHLIFLSAIAALHFKLPRELSIGLLALVVPFAAVAERNNKPSLMMSAFMARLGDASYSVYLIHILLAIPVLYVLRKIGLIGSPAAVGAALATYAAVILSGLLVYTRFEVPLRRRLSGVRGEKTSLAFAQRLQAAQSGQR